MSALKNWGEEKQSAYLYKIVAIHEKDPSHRQLFNELGNSAEKQALIWEKEIKKMGQAIPIYRPSFRTRIVGWLAHHFSAKQLKFILAAMKVRGMSIYIGDIHPHNKIAPTATHQEQNHKSINTGGNLRAAVFGINDGLISNMSLLLGIAGATNNTHIIILTGTAGLLAGACSMASGEYISVRSQREFFEYQIALERSELEEYPEEEAQELALIYETRGLPKEDAEKLAKTLISNPESALDTLAREELGLNPNELGSPWGAAISSFLSFAMGAFIPLGPFFFSNYLHNLWISIGLTSLTLFGIGASLSLFTNSNALKSGLRMLLIGALAGSLTYFIGSIIGVTTIQ